MKAGNHKQTIGKLGGIGSLLSQLLRHRCRIGNALHHAGQGPKRGSNPHFKVTGMDNSCHAWASGSRATSLAKADVAELRVAGAESLIRGISGITSRSE